MQNSYADPINEIDSINRTELDAKLPPPPPSISAALSYNLKLILHLRKFVTPVKKIKGAGQLVIVTNLDRSGKVLDSDVVKSSGDAAVDDVFLQAVKKASPFPGAPETLYPPAEKTGRFVIPINFDMKNGLLEIH